VSYSFDGVDDVLTVSPGTIPNTQVTFFVTLNPTSYGENAWGHLIAHGTGAEQTSRYAFYVDNASVGTSQALSFAASCTGGDGRWRANGAIALNGRWKSMTMTYDGALTTNHPAFYFDQLGVSVEPVQTPGGASNVPEPASFYLGNASTGTRTFAGQIGVFAMWNRVLNPSEVMLVHLCGVRKVLRGLQFWYRGTNGTGGADWSGRGRTATVTGALVSSDASGDRLAA
jgi:Concanavalin A-like lectin/glucanases superfamily